MSLPVKPKVCRLVDGRIGIFVGAAYQFTDDDGARDLRDQLDALLAPAPTTSRLDEFCQELAAEIAARKLLQDTPA